MGGLFTSFSVGVTGLTAAQAALNATSHNITNVDTKGFTRQQILLHDRDYHKTPVYAQGRNKDQTGLGTVLAEIRQVRDQFLDRAYRHEYGRQGFYDAAQNASGEIEDLFGELEGSTFQKEMEDMWTSIQEIQKVPESRVTRTDLVETASIFMDRCEDIYKQLNKYQQDLNEKVKKSVDRINEIGKQIFEINKKIVMYESGPENANDLRDERNKLIDELGNLADISVHNFDSGLETVNLEGFQFVTEFGYNEMKCTTLEDVVKLNHLDEKTDATNKDLYIPTWYDGTEVFNTDTELSPRRDNDIGYVKGLLLARGRKVGRFTDIPVKPVLSDFRTSATGVGKINDVTDLKGTDKTDYEKALGEYNEAMKEYNRKISPSVIVNSMAEFDQLIHGITTMINDILAPNFKATFSADGINDDGTIKNAGDITWSDADGNRLIGGRWLDTDGNDVTDTVDKDGRKAFYLLSIGVGDMNALASTPGRAATSKYVYKDEGAGKYSFSVLDVISAPIGLDSSKEQGNVLFSRKSVERYSTLETKKIPVTYKDPVTGKAETKNYEVRAYNIENPDDLYSMFTLGEERVNQVVKENVSKLPISSVADTGDYDAKTADKLAALWEKPFATLNPNALTKNTFLEYYTSFTGEIANTGNTYKNITESQENTVASVDDKRQQVLGVNADEELTYLIKFQQTYNANSRYITVIDDMLDTLINRLA